MNDGIVSAAPNRVIDFLHQVITENEQGVRVLPVPTIKRDPNKFQSIVPFDREGNFLNPKGYAPGISEGYVRARGGELLGRLKEANIPAETYGDLESALKEVTSGHQQLEFAKTSFRNDILHSSRSDAIKVAKARITAASEKTSGAIEKWAIAASHLEKSDAIEKLVTHFGLAKAGQLEMKALAGGALVSAGIVEAAPMAILFLTLSLGYTLYRGEKISLSNSLDAISMALPLGASLVFDTARSLA